MKKIYKKNFVKESYSDLGLSSFLGEVVEGFDIEERAEWDGFVRGLKGKSELEKKVSEGVKDKLE